MLIKPGVWKKEKVWLITTDLNIYGPQIITQLAYGIAIPPRLKCSQKMKTWNMVIKCILSTMFQRAEN